MLLDHQGSFTATKMSEAFNDDKTSKKIVLKCHCKPEKFRGLSSK